LVIDLDQFQPLTAQTILPSVLRQGFQLFEQSQWDQGHYRQPRGQVYPVQAIPRYYRWEMQKNLQLFIKNQSTKNLRHFSYWYNKWKATGKDEYLSETDRMAGSAEYYMVEMMTRVLNQNTPESLSPIAYFKQLKQLHLPLYDKLSHAYEAAVLGAMSGLILQRRRRAGWQRRITQGVSPLELLANEQAPLTEVIDQISQSRFLRATVEKMKELDPKGDLDRIIRHLANPKIVKAAVPLLGLKPHSFSSSATYRSFFDYPGVKGVVMHKLNSDFRLLNDDFYHQFEPGEYWVTAQQTPCGNSPATVLIYLPENVVLSSTKMTIKKPRTRHYEGGLVKTGPDLWFCMTTLKKRQ
jgi:hypothetical protein